MVTSDFLVRRRVCLCGHRADSLSNAPPAKVLGSGIAGLTYALELAQHGRVAVVSKDVVAESNTQYAQVCGTYHG